ncbi:NAD(+) kinase [Phlyctochytrium planicorne]|nr:NAD(+) kinase [Phlyctochytrium planicorne]KAJ3109683.1 NAD(+) kinase [Phlyctochytrium planicorne]
MSRNSKESKPGDASARLLRELTDISKAAVRISPLRKVVVVSRPGKDICEKTLELTRFLVGKGVEVLLEKKDLDALKKANGRSGIESGAVGSWNKEFCRKHSDSVDMVVTLGGDGTVLFANYLFQNKVPPILSFHLGSLGFLTVFDFDGYKEILDAIIEGAPQRLNYRMRLKASLYKYTGEKGGLSSSAEHGRDFASSSNTISYEPPTSPPTVVAHVLNEVVIDRGANPTMMTLELLFVPHCTITRS